jgi:hypothetical protein
MKFQLGLVASLLLATAAHAQSIERVKMTDNDLSCQQIYVEITQMDAVIARANTPGAAPGAAPGVAGQVAAGVAGAVAQGALANAAARSGGFGGMFGGAGGGLGGMFGQLAGAVAQNAAAAPAPAPAAAAPAVDPALTAQANGRKEHLTGLFLGKGCKMSDIQR